MCGIVGITQAKDGSILNDLLPPLQRLEYRGYDSCGFVTTDGLTVKDTSTVTKLIENTDDHVFSTGISHTRWATHGGVTTINAHPHFNTNNTIFAVHNGVIENYEDIKLMLERNGNKFISETDSEIIPHYFHCLIEQGLTTEQAIQHFFTDVRGTYAVLLINKNENRIYAFAKASPLCIGIGNNFNVVASDSFAFNNKTTNVVFFEDYEYATIDANGYQFFDKHGTPTDKNIIQIDAAVDSTQGDYDHFMMKEIMEQPKVARRIVQSLHTDQQKALDSLADYVDQAKQTIIIACGTSYHAALIGGSVLARQGYNIHVVVASEFDTFHFVDQDTLVIAISQSGETMDVLTVLKEAQNHGAQIAALTNVPYSSIQRMADISINILAGQEVAVASTKAFTNQVITLLSVAAMLDGNGMADKIRNIPLRIEETINNTILECQSYGDELKEHQHAYFLGRGLSYPVSREMALKMKEISYIHAEGMMGAEWKHGSMALVDAEVQTPIFILVPNNDPDMLSCAHEVAARGAQVIKISNTDNADIRVPSGEPLEFAIYASVVGQLLAYYAALALERNIDQPRNLAKCVTVK